MEYVAYGCLIVLASGCLWFVGHSFIDSFFRRKEELVDQFKTELRKDL